MTFFEELSAARHELGAASPIGGVILVNDGSSSEYNDIFEKCVIKYGCILLRHCVNLGKGRALKTAFNHFLSEFPDFAGVITADSDGQHSVCDIFKCAEAFLIEPKHLILGSRDFSEANVPRRSSFGNRLTRSIFRGMTGAAVSDTQTGLRVIPRNYLPVLMTTRGERFEFELNMLIGAREHGIEITEIPIETIYIENNRSSHFNPLRDSARVYASFAKFILSSAVSFIVDIGLFTLLSALLYAGLPGFEYKIFAATAAARACSSLLNYSINKKMVFRNNISREALLRYYILAGAQMILSAVFVYFTKMLIPLNLTGLKIIIDSLLFLISFNIQNFWVFRNK